MFSWYGASNWNFLKPLLTKSVLVISVIPWLVWKNFRASVEKERAFERTTETPEYKRILDILKYMEIYIHIYTYTFWEHKVWKVCMRLVFILYE